MREVAERRQQLELEHEQALAILKFKQDEIKRLQRVRNTESGALLNVFTGIFLPGTIVETFIFEQWRCALSSRRQPLGTSKLVSAVCSELHFYEQTMEITMAFFNVFLIIRLSYSPRGSMKEWFRCWRWVFMTPLWIERQINDFMSCSAFIISANPRHVHENVKCLEKIKRKAEKRCFGSGI